MMTGMNGNNSETTAFNQVAMDPAFQMITVTKAIGLGLNIVGGINRNEGPLVYIQEIIAGGDCHKDGRLKPGDQLVYINKESLIGVSFEEAKSIITRAKLRSESAWEIGFIRQKLSSNQQETTQRSSLLSSTEGCETQVSTSFNVLSHHENFDQKMSSTPITVDTTLMSLKKNQIKTGFKKREPSPITSPNNSPTDVSNPNINPNWPNDTGLQGENISLDPSIRLKIEKLEMALNYLGIQPTEEEHKALRQQVQIDSKGTVSFGDFVQVSRELFRLQLNEVTIGQKSTMLSAREISHLLESQLLPHDSSEMDEVEKLKHERNDALREVSKLKDKLLESENQRKQLTEELQNVKQEAKAVVEETRALRSRLHLAEAAQRQAHGMEMDYEEVIRLLEAEIKELKAQLADHTGQSKESFQDLRKRITVLDCQLRKSETARKTFELTTEKLLNFVETIQEVLSDHSSSLSNFSDRRSILGSQTLFPQLGRNGRNVTANLVQESRELAKSVRALLDVDRLPYGWEEAYTADGIKYFINHVTQTTSWIHPVTSALNLSCLEENEEDCPRDRPNQKS
ncbi:syntaxin-binding protein 4 isoform X1 [Sarcophilus harrisii]|uniref:Syntaxin binding protein 4 n=1 Tax=Sarcophilus harrisii TaxID=9305 RepID=A0A7N4PCD4_SARHA|nr:syntaxin-binding protein 4 isoform X1 [Sarcophilus harrisii]XP_031822295.1 syntaxin-binding protein 4 isoform X1 [Sarcophilus harrisii]